MNNIFDKNIKALRNKYPEVAEYYMKYTQEGSDESVIADVQIVADKKILVAYKNGKAYQLDSLYDSSNYLNMWFDNIQKGLMLESKYIMFGFGNGMCARMFLSCANMDNTLIVYEPCESIFYTTLCNFDVSDVLSSDNMMLWVPSAKTNIQLQNQLEDVLKLTDVTTASSGQYMNYEMLFPSEVKKFYSAIEKVLEKVQINNSFLALRGKLINQNIKSNLKYFAKSKRITDLKDALTGIPAIIVSAGPSLNKNISDLASAKGKSIIIAVDSAINTVKKNGISPDLIVAVDPRKDERFLGEDKCIGVPFITNMRANAGIVREHEGVKFFDNTLDHFIQKYVDDNNIELPELETGGSVATTAFSVAKYMGCSPIILIGQDLAYTNDETHAKESVDAFRTVEELNGSIMDIDIYGNPIKTSDDMLRYKEWFERSIEIDPDRVVYDATEGGALIKGSIVTTLSEVISKECAEPYEVSHVFKNASPVLDDEHITTFIMTMMKMPDNLSEDKDILRKLLLNYEKMLEMVSLNKYNTTSFQSLSRKSNELLSQVEDDPIMDYVMNVCHDRTNNIFASINHVEADEKEELKSVIEISIKYANILKDAIDEVVADVTEMVESLKTV